MQLLKNEKFLIFTAGVATALIGKKVLKSQSARRFAVKGMAAGMKLQKDVFEAFQNIKEEAADLCLEELDGVKSAE